MQSSLFMPHFNRRFSGSKSSAQTFFFITLLPTEHPSPLPSSMIAKWSYTNMNWTNNTLVHYSDPPTTFCSTTIPLLVNSSNFIRPVGSYVCKYTSIQDDATARLNQTIRIEGIILVSFSTHRYRMMQQDQTEPSGWRHHPRCWAAL